MEAVLSSEKLVKLYHTTRRRIVKLVPLIVTAVETSNGAYILSVSSELLGVGFCPSTDILKNRGSNVSETGSVSVLRRVGRQLLCWAP
jgi:hypothetical protein